MINLKQTSQESPSSRNLNTSDTNLRPLLLMTYKKISEGSTPMNTEASSKQAQTSSKFFAKQSKANTIISQPQNQWKNVFGTFISNISTDSPQQKQRNQSVKKQDYFIKYSPLDRPTGNTFYKEKLGNFIDGAISEDQLLQYLNFPKLQKKLDEQKLSPFKAAAKNVGQIYKMKKYFKRKTSALDVVRRVEFKNDESRLSAQLDQAEILLLQAEQKRIQEEHRLMMKTKLQKLKDLIAYRIQFRQEENNKSRMEDIQTNSFVKTFFQITSDLQEKVKTQNPQNKDLYFTKQLPATKQLKTFRLNFEDVGSLSKNIPMSTKSLREESMTSRATLRQTLKRSTQAYLEELENKQTAHKEKLNRQVKLNIDSINSTATRATQMKNKGITPQSEGSTFKMFNKVANKVQSTKNNVKEIMTFQDLQLYDYLFNPPTSKVLKLEQNPEYVKHLLYSEGDLIQEKARETFIYKRQNIKIRMKTPLTTRSSYQKRPHQRGEIIQDKFNDEISVISNNSSMKSTYEVNLDNIYSQTREIKNKVVNEQRGFAKRIKQLIKLEELSKNALQTNLQKLKQ